MKNSEFITGEVPITKEEVRAISINKLDLKDKKTFLDIGAGTGSVSVEVAYNYPDIDVISIECKDKAVDLIKRNIEKFKLKNIEVIQGYAPIKINKKVDAIFIGGSGPNLKEILEWSKLNLNENGTLVANFIIIDTFYKTLNLLKDLGFKDIEATMLNVAKLEKLGKGEYFKPLNPIYIISCKKGEMDYE
ncbi:decarboxylating cobalt-precorrin-6B (C(15))-methyltransferase [Paraclostridium sordellii]|uniref:Cobalt-precorrin-6Y C(15)-methyltransferase n=1 Tax=Paraclostridium sordellii TaxID=1505 RepID=A0A0C7PHB4_PARSO|nr:decarboxylating cobalt-precorrin-6B (C(15))-methyltransferase [Paeniclostridium sordellii]QYE97799.1 decarboxylating cobalt-precorrin-6B (C(15))-methyltransferase [Paeniclostridium sordellii]CEN79390.1 cobalt-precorrin-6Y C(15)-methyltransferase [[Clostridium] sordellii] [Paeniclostridium sordellii]CEO10907.1 cobalt-precorrin-6Y C(15)-methyltransferase [[Clostridium] sordellii] [Paeniclostridium sordellii]CEP87727.1 cobalt-precorrin-6Y C(15)-methyltransferase [[Clostridium] sordellii] [Paeni